MDMFAKICLPLNSLVFCCRVVVLLPHGYSKVLSASFNKYKV